MEEIILYTYSIDTDTNMTKEIDEDVKIFKVPKIWARKKIMKRLKMTLKEFFSEYTYDWSLKIYHEAKAENVLIN